ncbi:hypothetical protein IscW_ISCW007000 [Ixodes scapularis]|uniref:Uncharacterized protein n=1 Tax=Ixodes scapularis TaxID=6945 RepID=B7PT21_IXOSC|nr:hypothetical protein IscW_ISCW007000 [Ixodes scapularis]|eukprot:XP_002403648.1 hypothetical protein IscW_ISCW007000 [Ixodes scapularis]
MTDDPFSCPPSRTKTTRTNCAFCVTDDRELGHTNGTAERSAFTLKLPRNTVPQVFHIWRLCSRCRISGSAFQPLPRSPSELSRSVVIVTPQSFIGPKKEL